MIFLLTPSDFTFNAEFSDYKYSHLLWNFPDAETIALEGYAQFPGAVLIANSNSTTTVSVPGHNGRFVTCGDLVHTIGSAGGREFHNYPFSGNFPDLPAELFGYLFKDENSDQIRNTGDITITNALVSLSINGVAYSNVYTDADGFYEFIDIPVGVATVQVVQAGADLVCGSRH